MIAIYGRVSTKKQSVDGYGLDVQLEELVRKVEDEGQDYREYIDEGISGTSIDKREGLQQLLEDIKSGQIKEVHVTKLSRLGRNTRDVLNILHEFEKYNIIFKSIRDGIDTSNKMGMIVVQFMSIVAEMERDVIIETTRAGAEYRAALGKIYGSPPILGYNRIGRSKDSYLEVNEDEAVIIKKVFVLYNQNLGYKAIVSKLNEGGFRSKHGNLFAINTIKSILNNPIYVGKIRYNYHKDWNKKRRKGKQDEYILVDGSHDAIITDSEWVVTQELMKTRTVARGPVTGKFLLNQVLKCPQCGSGMVGSNRTRYRKSGKVTVPYYTCGANHNKGREACAANSMSATRVEEIVLRKLTEYLKQEDLAEMLYEYIVHSTIDINDLPAKIKVLQNDLELIDGKVKRIKDMYEEGFIKRTEMSKKLKVHTDDSIRIKAAIEQIREQMVIEFQPEIDITVDEIKTILKDLYTVFSDSNDRLLLKKFLGVVIDSIQVKNRLQADMQVNLKFTDELLKLFNKEVPKGANFEYEDKAGKTS